MPRFIDANAWLPSMRRLDDIAGAGHGAAEDVESGPDIADAAGRERAKAFFLVGRTKSALNECDGIGGQECRGLSRRVATLPLRPI